MVPRECSWLLALASQLIPGLARDSWRKEWEGRIWYAGLTAARAGKGDRAIRNRQLREAVRAFPDALGRRIDRKTSGTRFRQVIQNPLSCLLILCAGFGALVLASGGLNNTVRAITGPDWDAGRLATVVVQESFMGKQKGVRPEWIGQWRNESQKAQEIAYYNFRPPWPKRADTSPWAGRHATVSTNFFNVLGVEAASGRVFRKGDEQTCKDCVIITESLRRNLLPNGGVGDSLDIDGDPRRVIGILPRNFWFLADELAAFTPEPSPVLRRAIVLVRLKPGSAAEEAERELRAIAGEGVNVKSAMLMDRLQSPVRRYGAGALFLLCGVLGVTLWGLVRRTGTTRYWMFFALKTSLGLLIVLSFTLEHTGLGSLTLTGSGRLATEVLALWVWSVANCLFLWWSVADQRRRCRLCARVLIMPVRIGYADRVLFDHGATETICPGGHGTLFVEDTTETFRQSGRWTELDESWRDLFVSSREEQ
jgi:hypothetical protein